MKRILTTFASIALLSASPLSHATNLVQALQAALNSDPIYKQAEAQYHADKTQVAQARAGVLPQIDLQASINRNNVFTGYRANNQSATPNTNQSLNSRGFTLSLTQPIFDWAAFKQIAQAKAAVQASASTYAAAGQTLITSLASAYFNVLEAQDIVRYSEAQKKALYRQYIVTRQRYRVGLDAIPALYKSQAAYDGAKAEYLADKNNLSNMREELRQITGNYYVNLKTLENNFPLVSPNPMNINQWVKTALEKNLGLRAARFNVMAAEENVKVQASGNMPTIDATGSLQDAYQKTVNTSDQDKKDVRTGSVGLALNFPIYQGGIVGAQTNQAEANYQIAIAQMEGQYRATVANTRKAYLSVISQISQVKADRQSIKSHVAALESIQAGYQAGTQTILDVLTAQSALFSAERDYAKDRFAYLLNTLKLKQAAGILSPNDLTNINRWLTATTVTPKTMNAHTKVSKPTTHKHPKKVSTKKIRRSTTKKTSHNAHRK